MRYIRTLAAAALLAAALTAPALAQQQSSPPLPPPVAGDCLVGTASSWISGACGTSGGGGTTSLNTSSLVETLPNDGATGTGAGLLAVYTTAAQAKTAAVTDTSAVIGICVSGISGTSCGTTGNGSFAIAGQAGCVFDGATTAGDFVVASTSVAGNCHDAGNTVPASVQVLGYVLSTHGAGGTYAVDISNVGTMAALNAKSQPGGSNGQIQFNSSNKFGALAGTSCTAAGVCTWTAAQTFAAVVGSITTDSTTARTLSAADCGTEVNFTNSAAVTVTMPNSIPAGCHVALRQGNTGAVSVAAGSGATINSPHGFTKTFSQYSIIGLSVATNSGGSSAVADFTGDGS